MNLEIVEIGFRGVVMRVCFFIAEMDGIGGTERVSCMIADALVAVPEVTAVTMLSLMGSTDCRFNLDASVSRESLFSQRGSMTRRFPLAVQRLRQRLRRNRVDVLIVADSALCLFAIPAAARLGVRLICWEHFNFKYDAGRKKRVFARHLAALFADDVLTLTHRDREYWEAGTFGRARILTIPNPSPYSGLLPNYDVQSRTVLAVGRLTRVKGFDLLLDAWAEVKRSAAAGVWRLKIVGDGEERSSLERQVVELGITTSVEIRPATSAIDEEYRGAAILCCSSRSEGLGMVLIEGHQHGVPIVSFDCDTGPREIVVDGETGVLVPPENRTALALALLDLMVNAETRSAMSASAAKYSSRFSKDVILAQWRALLTSSVRTPVVVDGGALP